MTKRELQYIKRSHKELCDKITDLVTAKREMEECINDHRGHQLGVCSQCGADTVDGKSVWRGGR